MKKKLVTAIVCTGMTAALLCGCGNMVPAIDRMIAEKKSSSSMETEGIEPESIEPESIESEETVADEFAGIDPEMLDLIKYNTYVNLNNYIVEVLDNIDYYYQVVAYEDEFSMLPDTGLYYGFNIYYLNTDILEEAAALVEVEPFYGELDTMTRDIIEPMRTMMDVFNTINKSTDFAENQYAKAKEYHEIIQQNADSFYAMGLEYIAALDEIADERIAKEEAQMLADGRLIIYNSSHAITIVDKILDECSAQGVSDSNITELDLEPIKVLYDELLATVAAYDAAVSDNNQLIMESLSNPAPFDGLLNSLAASVEWMIMQVESGQPVTDIELSPLGSIGHIYEVYGQCTDRYNSVFID